MKLIFNIGYGLEDYLYRFTIENVDDNYENLDYLRRVHNTWDAVYESYDNDEVHKILCMSLAIIDRENLDENYAYKPFRHKKL